MGGLKGERGERGERGEGNHSKPLRETVFMRQFAISDIHGCPKTFLALLDKIAFSKSDELFLLGDYVDRGPDSKGVLDAIFDLQKNGYTLRCLLGNHEELVLQAAQNDFASLERWLLTDGRDTMDSFGVERCSDIPEVYLDFMRGLPYFFESGNYILVHGGLDFRLPDPLADASEMCWMRNWYDDIRYEWLGERTILHGHTPIEHYNIEKQLFQLKWSRYLDIDAGCVFTQHRFPYRVDLGRLCAFDMTNRWLAFQKNVE